MAHDTTTRIPEIRKIKADTNINFSKKKSVQEDGKDELTSLYASKLLGLINGVLGPKEASIWAEQEMHRLDKEGVVFRRGKKALLDNLMLAGALNEHGGYLYTKNDFEGRLRDS